MAFIPVPDCVEVAIEFTVAGAKPQKVVFNVTSTVAWVLSTAEALASDIVDFIISFGLDWITHDMSISSIHMTDLSSSSGFSFDWLTGSGSNTLPQSGTDTGDITSGQTALVTTLRTASRGRSYRGRNYWPGLASHMVGTDGVTIGTGRVSSQDAFVNGLVAAIHSNPVRTLVVVSRHQNKTPLITGVATPVTSHDTNNHVDTQRRRVRP